MDVALEAAARRGPRHQPEPDGGVRHRAATAVVIATGLHRVAGGPHAEVDALTHRG